MDTFKEFNLPLSLSQALQKMSFTHPTPIQKEAIPIGLTDSDLIGCAQTGTGKTGAFCIPIAVKLINHPDKIAVVLAPTRELAGQIEEFWKKLTHFNPELRSVSLIGGMPMQPQIRNIQKKPRLVVATPGRLVDHLNRGNLSLSKTAVLVLDEADRMLDMGFAPQLKQVLKHLPKVRQTFMFSATLPPNIEQLSKQYLKNPVRIQAGNTNQAASKISQTAISTHPAKKNETLLDTLNEKMKDSSGPILIFARTQARTDRVARYLNSYGLEVNRLHGGRTQGQRKSALDAFKQGRIRILVATDIAARGIDVAGIAHVINYDLPQMPEDYIHRIGRTARAGTSGQATSIVTTEDQKQWKEILRLLKKSNSDIPTMTQAFH